MSVEALFATVPDEADPLDAALDLSEDLVRQLEHANDQRKLLANMVRRAARTALIYPAQLRQIWANLCAAGWSGRAEEVHEQRRRFLALFENRARYLARLQNLSVIAAPLTGNVLDGADRLGQATADLNRIKAEVLDRWETLEDLENLLAESFPLPPERLEAVAAKYPPPQAWYDEEHNPF